MSRLACEGCHRKKARCLVGPNQSTCSRCSRLGMVCHARIGKRMGRPPIAPDFSHGSSEVLDFNGAETSLPTRYREPQHNPDARLRSYLDVNHGIIGRSSESTQRFKEIHHGFGAHTETHDSRHFWLYPKSVLDSPTYIPLGNVRARRQLKSILGTKDGFFALHRHFMVGQSFTDQYQSAVRLSFSHSPHVLADAYYTLLELIQLQAFQPATAANEISLKRGAHCLESLVRTSSSISRVNDAAALLMLGQILFVYNILIPLGHANIIVRNTLLSVKDWYPTLIKQPELDAMTLAPVFVDTMNCLVRREVPILQLSICDRAPADRYIGLCASLLTLLYTLCELSCSTKSSGLSTSITELGTDIYSDVEHQISVWEPTLPSNFLTQYSPSEVSTMMAQARVYRSAALLVIHRLRFPLGIKDDVGQRYAQVILSELAVMKQWSLDGACGFGVNFPLLLASLELLEPTMEILKVVEPLRFDRQSSKQIMKFAIFVTRKRNSGFCGLWFDLVQNDQCNLVLP